jgi:hypothetical protein
MDNETKTKIHHLVDAGKYTAKFALKSNAEYFAKLLKKRDLKVQVFMVEGHSPTVEGVKKLLDKHFHVEGTHERFYNTTRFKLLGNAVNKTVPPSWSSANGVVNKFLGK